PRRAAPPQGRSSRRHRTRSGNAHLVTPCPGRLLRPHLTPATDSYAGRDWQTPRTHRLRTDLASRALGTFANAMSSWLSIPSPDIARLDGRQRRADNHAACATTLPTGTVTAGDVMNDPVGDLIGDYGGFAAMQHERLLARGIDIGPYALSHLA